MTHPPALEASNDRNIAREDRLLTGATSQRAVISDHDGFTIEAKIERQTNGGFYEENFCCLDPARNPDRRYYYRGGTAVAAVARKWRLGTGIAVSPPLQRRYSQDRRGRGRVGRSCVGRSGNERRHSPDTADWRPPDSSHPAWAGVVYHAARHSASKG